MESRIVQGPYVGLWRERMWAILRLLLAGLLLVTALAKVWYAADLLRSTGILSQPWVLAAAVGVECGAAVVLLAAPSNVGFITAATVFSFFAVVSGASLFAGRDCGCFGPQTDSLWPLLLDLSCLGCLALARPSLAGPSLKSSARQLATIGAVSLLISGAFGLHLARSSQSEDGMPLFFSDNLVGKQWPLLTREGYVDKAIRRDKSVVVLLRPDCEHCREFAVQWQSAPLPGVSDEQVIGIAVETGRWTVMPGSVSADPLAATDGSNVLHWDAGTEPFVATPAVFVVEGRKVGCAVDGDAALQALRDRVGVDELCD